MLQFIRRIKRHNEDPPVGSSRPKAAEFLNEELLTKKGRLVIRIGVIICQKGRKMVEYFANLSCPKCGVTKLEEMPGNY
jgi:hypothetical protein